MSRVERAATIGMSAALSIYMAALLARAVLAGDGAPTIGALLVLSSISLAWLVHLRTEH